MGAEQWFFGLQPPVQAAIISAVVSAAVAVLLAILSPVTQRRIERVKSDLQSQLEVMKAGLAEEAASSAARRAYVFDARKRLYTEIEPLLFQLFEAAEGSYYRVASLVRTQRQGFLGRDGSSWLSGEGYYLYSTVYRLFLPLGIFRLIQRSTTFVDLNLDGNVRIRYFLLKLSYYVFTDDFVVAALNPALEYDPIRPDWQSSRQRDPSRFWRQGLVIGDLDNLIDNMLLVDGNTRRLMTYGEFETTAVQRDVVQPALDLLTGFSFVERPVLARILLAHALFMRLLLLTYSRSVGVEELTEAMHSFIGSAEAEKDLKWWTGDESAIEPVLGYVATRMPWLSPYDYDIAVLQEGARSPARTAVGRRLSGGASGQVQRSE
jgi:hypothetical protein